MSNCTCGNPLPAICKVSKKCDYCSVKILQNRKKQKMKDKLREKQEERKNEPIYPSFKPKFLKKSKKSQKKERKAIDTANKFGSELWFERADSNGEVHCEECKRYLGRGDNYIPAAHGNCISHILTGGAWKELYGDPENVNILCGPCHANWENLGDREKMRIYEGNLARIDRLKQRSKYFRND